MLFSPNIFVINLEHRVDRRTEMAKQLSRVGWNAEFFPAVRPTTAANFPSIGARGAFLSHLSVLKKAEDARVNQLIILEDDVNFISGFAERWSSAISSLQSTEWSIFYPGHVLDSMPSGLFRISPSLNILCAHFMVINGSAISTLVNGLETILSRPSGHPLGSPMHVDGAYSTIRKQNPSLVTYVHFPTLGYQRPSRSDIGRLKWFDRLNALAQLVSFGRRFKGMCERLFAR